MSIYHLTLLTPQFSRGTYSVAAASSAEIRPPSIRGQLHHWFRLLGGSYDQERLVFGSVYQGSVASRVVVRVSNIEGVQGISPTLPHKSGGMASPKAAYKAKTTFDVHVLMRGGALPFELQVLLDRTIEAWLLLGSLGLRATRGGGAIQWDGAPSSVDAFKARVHSLIGRAPLRFAVLDQHYGSAEEARRHITDTISHSGTSDLGYPLGAVRQREDGPDTPRRKTSPLRLTVRQLDGGFRIIAVWDNRIEVTGNTLRQLDACISRLAKGGPPMNGPKAIGLQLERSGIAK